MADIAVLQARTLEQQQVMREKEFQSMREQLLDLQSETDEKALIGKLHRHIIQLQISEGSLTFKSFQKDNGFGMESLNGLYVVV